MPKRLTQRDVGRAMQFACRCREGRHAAWIMKVRNGVALVRFRDAMQREQWAYIREEDAGLVLTRGKECTAA